MKKLLRVTTTVILTLGVLAGCTSHKEVANQDTIGKEIVQEKKQENIKNVETEQESKNEEKNSELNQNIEKDYDTEGINIKKNADKGNQIVQQVTKQQQVTRNEELRKHNFTEASKLLNVLTYGVSCMESSTISQLVQFNAIYGTEGTIKYIPMTKIVDELNTYNKGTYNTSDVITMLSIQKNYNFTIIEKSFKEYNTHQKENLLGEKQTIVYSKKDNTLAVRVRNGIGGASDCSFDTPQNWRVNGDTISIDYINVITNKKTAVLTLRLNNKHYASGADKTMYYVESFVFL